MDQPKILADDEIRQARLAQLDEPHMRPLTQFVCRLREEMGEDAAIPNFDPWDGGINAEVLFLLEAPGPRARNSAFVSMNNPDETAKNFFLACQTTGIERKRIVIWNIVPWYIGSDTRIRAANASDIKQGIGSLTDLLSLLPKLRAIVLVGKKAQRAEKHLATIAPELTLFTSPHPSPMFVNNKPGNRDVLIARLQPVQQLLASQACNSTIQ